MERKIYFRNALGQFSSPDTRGKFKVYNQAGKIISGAARKAVIKRYRKRTDKPRPRVIKPQRRGKPHQKADKPSRRILKSFINPFRKFLEPIGNRKRKFRAFAICRITFNNYFGSPVRDIPIFLGVLSPSQAESVSKSAIVEIARNRWGRVDVEVLFIAALKGSFMRYPSGRIDKVRGNIAGKMRRGKR